MKRYYMIGLTVAVFVIATGISTVLAGGSSDTSGEGSHCYLLFALPDGTFAQCMISDTSEEVVLIKALEYLKKYIIEEEANLETAVGNIYDSFCAPIDQWCTVEEIPFLPDWFEWEEIASDIGIQMTKAELVEKAAKDAKISK